MCYFGPNKWWLAFTIHSGIQETLPRLTAMIRGIGDPLVAAYTRAYLCRVRPAHFLSFILYFCLSFRPFFLDKCHLDNWISFLPFVDEET